MTVTAALEMSENQVTHLYSKRKNTKEILKLLDVLLEKYAGQSCIYFSWDAASWHASKKLYERVDEIDSVEYQATHHTPIVRLAPLPSSAQFLNVIESVFSGMSRAIIHNSDYQSTEECMRAVDRYFDERNKTSEPVQSELERRSGEKKLLTRLSTRREQLQRSAMVSPK